MLGSANALCRPLGALPCTGLARYTIKRPYFFMHVTDVLLPPELPTELFDAVTDARVLRAIFAADPPAKRADDRGCA
jgi:hypothetical protein